MQQRSATAMSDVSGPAPVTAQEAAAQEAPAAAQPTAQEPPAAQDDAAQPAPSDRLAAHLAANRAKAKGPVDRPPPPQWAKDDEEDEAVAPDGRTMTDVRMSILLVKEQEVKHDWRAKKGSIVPKAPTLGYTMTLGRTYRDATFQFADKHASPMAAELGIEEHVMQTLLEKYLRKHVHDVIDRIRTNSVITGDSEDETVAEAIVAAEVVQVSPN